MTARAQSRLAAALLFAALAAFACTDREGAPAQAVREPPPRASSEEAHEEHVHRELAGGEVPELSLYQLEGDWTTASGVAQPLSALAGEPVLLLLFYGSCDTACPALVHDLERVASQLGPASSVRFALVTFDPEHDTAENLTAYAAARSLAAPRWTLLRGSSDQVRELAAAVGVRYRAVGDGQFSHTMRILLLDRSGTPVEHWDGLTRPIEPIARRARELAALPR